MARFSSLERGHCIRMKDTSWTSLTSILFVRQPCQQNLLLFRFEVFILYLLHNLSIFGGCKTKRIFFRDISFEICQDCLARLSSGRFSTCTRTLLLLFRLILLMEISLVHINWASLINPRELFAEKTCVFLTISFSQ